MNRDDHQLVLFRRDLRVTDNPALGSALASGPCLAMYVLDDSADGRPLGEAARWWLHHALVRLRLALADLGVPLVLRQGLQNAEVLDVARHASVTVVCWNRRYTPWGAAADLSLESDLSRRGIQCRSFDTGYLRAPGEVRTRSGGWFRAFRPFFRAQLAMGEPPEPVPDPVGAQAPAARPSSVPSDRLGAWRLLPSSRERCSGLSEAWPTGRDSAEARLSRFLESKVERYRTDRNRPDLEGVSTLSPFLAFGQISPRQVWHQARAACGEPRGNPGLESFLRQLVWRDFCAGLLCQEPDLRENPMRPAFKRFPWRHDDGLLCAWQRGRTGFPWVDAGMRQLAATGWMHNRVRMGAASFLTKDLLLPWQAGERWFWEMLVDADPAQNAANWQWVAGCGADAVPFFRIFNPMLQGERFDPSGDYRRRWLPRAAGYGPGAAGVPPIVDHSRARAAALRAFRGLRRD